MFKKRTSYIKLKSEIQIQPEAAKQEVAPSLDFEVGDEVQIKTLGKFVTGTVFEKLPDSMTIINVSLI